MNVTVNGKDYKFDEPVNITDMLEKLNITSQWIVVELNFNIVNKEDYSKTFLNNNDVIEVIGFVGGG
jgi:sulfur carrier protein